ncbi:MAG: nuclear transport factor 2 family protein [Gammaproteobacteria bacterium]|nr:nuclear transport factor 2 family protein [Gammaproteobacteria bacterium]
MPSIDQDKRDVVALVHRIFDSYLQFDPELLEQCDAPECTIWDLFEPDLVRGGAAARAEFRKKDMTESQQRGPLTIDVEEPVVDVWGDFAVARYYLEYEFQPPGALKGRVRITTVARRIDGEWRRVHHQEGEVPTGRPPR